MKPATQIVHWPGKDTPACDEHARQLQGLAIIMGIMVSATPCQVETPCTNCANQAQP
jgi:hypothetical protein